MLGCIYSRVKGNESVSMYISHGKWEWMVVRMNLSHSKWEWRGFQMYISQGIRERWGDGMYISWNRKEWSCYDIHILE